MAQIVHHSPWTGRDAGPFGDMSGGDATSGSPTQKRGSGSDIRACRTPCCRVQDIPIKATGRKSCSTGEVACTDDTGAAVTVTAP